MGGAQEWVETADCLVAWPAGRVNNAHKHSNLILIKCCAATQLSPHSLPVGRPLLFRCPVACRLMVGQCVCACVCVCRLWWWWWCWWRWWSVDWLAVLSGRAEPSRAVTFGRCAQPIICLIEQLPDTTTPSPHTPTGCRFHFARGSENNSPTQLSNYRPVCLHVCAWVCVCRRSVCVCVCVWVCVRVCQLPPLVSVSVLTLATPTVPTRTRVCLLAREVLQNCGSSSSSSSGGGSSLLTFFWCAV